MGGVQNFNTVDKIEEIVWGLNLKLILYVYGNEVNEICQYVMKLIIVR